MVLGRYHELIILTGTLPKLRQLIGVCDNRRACMEYGIACVVGYFGAWSVWRTALLGVCSVLDAAIPR